jgi:acyl-CoA thioester hydrolase
MENFELPIQIRWADIDANRHLRHSVYYDYAAYCRMVLLTNSGLSTGKLEELGIGPILFREEAVFKREVLFEDVLRITCEIIKASEDYGRWSIQHQLLKSDNTVAAIITVDGAWIDLAKRKLALPDPFVQQVFRAIPKASSFEILPAKKV